MGQIITFDLGDGIIYNTPPIPSDEKEILYHDIKDKKNQYWRTPFDEKGFLNIVPDADLRRWSEKNRIEYIVNWRQKWANGFWFMNNGEPTHVNSLLCDHLTFNRFNNRFFNYVESQKEDFYFREFVLHNDELDGGMYIKPRRLGASAQEITENIHLLISDYHQNIALQSSTLEIAKKTLMLPLIDVYLSRPMWMRENYYKSNGKRPRSSLELVNVKSDDGDDAISWLGGRVNAYATNAKALDGTENIKVTNDELSKYPEGANPRDIVEVNRKTIRNAGRRGKHNLVSTSGDSDDVLTSFKEWVKLAGESKYNVATGTTVSGYVKRFASAIHSQYLPKELLADKYGKIDVGRNTEWVENEIAKKQKGTKEYYYEKRKMPLNEDDALIASTDANLFRKTAIISRRKYILGLPPNKKPYIRGNLIEKTVEGGAVKVYFEAKEDGVWLVAVHPYFDAARDIDGRNRFKYSDRGVYFPVSNVDAIVAYDPIRYDKATTKSNHLSRASIIVHIKYDYYNIKGSKEYRADLKGALYVGRPEKAETAHHEFCKAMKYWGAMGSFERQVESVLKYVDEQNMLPMVLKDEDNIAGIWTNAKVIDRGLEMLQSRYAAPQEEEQVDHIEIYPFEDGLLDLENFDRANTTTFDITMSEIFLEHGLSRLTYTNVTEESTAKLSEIMQELMPVRTKNSSFQ